MALAPATASAWWINQPRFEKVVVTEGDPEDPGIAIPNSPPAPEGTSQDDIEAVAQVMLTLLTEYIGL
jgi:hypothetical protein